MKLSQRLLFLRPLHFQGLLGAAKENALPMAQSLAELVESIELGPGCFESKTTPNVMADSTHDCGTSAFATNAASATNKKNSRVYSAIGNFLNVASTDSKLGAEVTAIRDTRTFATRRVDISQHTNKTDEEPR